MNLSWPTFNSASRRLALGAATTSLLALALVGCNGDAKPTAETPATAPAAATSSFKVALLTPGDVNDSGWNALAYNGLQAVKKETGAEVNNSKAAGSTIKDAMRTYAQQGYNLVFGHGFEYNDPAIDVAKDFPKTVFVSSSGGKTAANVGAFRFYLEQGFYLAGMLAGKMSKTGVIGEVGGVKGIPSIESTFTAFEAGAKAVRPDIKVIKVYSGTFDEAAPNQRATETLINQDKVDFVIHQANNGAEGVFKAAKAGGIYALGANADQNADPSGSVIGSAVIIADPAFVEIAKAVKAGTYKGEVTLYGMDKGAIDFVLNPAFMEKVPADVKKLLEDTKAQIKSGKLVVPKDNF